MLPLVLGSNRTIEYEHRCDRGHIAVIAQDCPRVRNQIAIDIQNMLCRLENFSTPGMQKETFEFTERQAVTVQEIIDRGTKSVAHKGRELRTENNPKTVTLDVPTHDVFGILPAMFTNSGDERAIPGRLNWISASAQHNGGRTIAK